MAWGQSSLFERLTMMTMDNGKMLLNTDGYDISAEILEMGFQSEEFKRFQTENDITEKSKRQNPLLSYRHFFVAYEHYQHKKYEKYIYFVEIPNDGAIFAFSFVGISHIEPSFLLHKELIESVLERKEDFEKIQLKSTEFSFLGRKISIPSECYWTNINSVQCPTGGQMSWSVYANKSQAEKQMMVMQKMLSDYPERYAIEQDQEEEEIIFEGVLTKSKKLTINVLTLKKKLISYYLVQEIRGRFVFCQLSFYQDAIPQDVDFPHFVGQFIQKVKKK